jgi:L-ascorbate metabolism protein UlaG (beta-lactamase superfamily)
MMSAGSMLSVPGYHGPISDHFNGKTFINPGGVKAKGGLEVFKWMLNRQRMPWKEDLKERYGQHPLGHFKGGIRITFVNHSTFLIQVDGVNILTDPVWSTRVSPYRWIGPKRMRLPGIKLEQLPKIHMVLLTHNHYDHLDLETMRTIFGAHHPRIVAPLGVKALLDCEYLSGALEVDWWQEIRTDGLTVCPVPAQHFSGRGLFDRDRTLWCGYVLKTGSGNIYFAGDTGYNEVTFKEIGAKCGPFKVSLLPIGAYKPGWFMAPIHVSPEESVKIHTDLKSPLSVAMHFGTFPLADDGSDDPVRDLKNAIDERRIPDSEFVVLKEGEPFVIE